MSPTLRRKPRIDDLRLPSYSVFPTDGHVRILEDLTSPPSYSDIESTDMSVETCRMGYILHPEDYAEEDTTPSQLSPVDVNLDDFIFEMQSSTIPEDTTLRSAIYRQQARQQSVAFAPEPSSPALPTSPMDSATSSASATLPSDTTLSPPSTVPSDTTPSTPASIVSSCILPSFNEIVVTVQARRPPSQSLVPVMTPRYNNELVPGYLRERSQGLCHPLIDIIPLHCPNQIVDEFSRSKVPGYAFISPTPALSIHRHKINLVTSQVQSIRYASDFEGAAHVVYCYDHVFEHCIQFDPRASTTLLRQGDQVIFNSEDFGFIYELTRVRNWTKGDAYVEAVAFDGNGRWQSEAGQGMTPFILVIPQKLIHADFNEPTRLRDDITHLERFKTALDTWQKLKPKAPKTRKTKVNSIHPTINPLLLPPPVVAPQKRMRELSLLSTTANAGSLSSSVSSRSRPKRSKTD